MPEDQQQPSAEELEELARRYVDLWQDQMTALAADPEFAESLQKIMAAMGLAASGMPAMWTAWPTALAGMMAAAQPPGQAQRTPGQRGETAGEPAGGRSATSTAGTPRGTAPGTSGPASAAAASPGGGADLGVLQERLAALEKRVRELEGGARRPRRSAKPKSGRN